MTKITKYKFHPKLVARTPRNPISFDLDEEILRQCFQKTVEKEAIFLASPHLYQAALDWQNGKTIEAKEKRKLLFSLAKYYIRSSFRPTPFGLFAGVGTTTWAEHTDIQLEAFNRQTRLDMTYLCALAYKISGLNPIKERLQYFKNSSLYTIGDEIRYVENYYESNRRFHKISAVKKNIYIIKVLKFVEKGGSSYSEIVSHLINNKNDKQEVIDFLDQLIDLQLLNSELEPSLTGNDFFYQIIKVLETINWDNDKTITTILSTLKDLDLRIKYLDENKINEPTEYFEIIQIIESLGVEYDINCLFQTDLGIITNLNSSVSDKYQRKIIEWIEFLQDINLNLPENNLEKFKTKFYGRFQNQEIQLSLALDTENGIGYLNKTNGDYTPLVEGIDFSNKQIKSFEFNDNQQKLFERLIEATHEGVYKIDLAAIPFEKTKKSDWTMPPSFNLLFREFENDTLYVESICGSSAATLLGRFAHKDSQISAIVREIVEEDEQLNPNVIFAEIVHLPENRTGNVIMHPHFHLYEIPYLAKSVLDKSNQIDLNDLYLSIVDDYLILRSAKLNKIVIPRLSNAHNYSDDALPVYQLLCDLQSQNTYQFLNFEWGDLANGFKFLPRVTYHSTIVSLATWSFKTEDLKNLKTVENFYELSKKYKIPDLFYLVDRDNELVVDPKNQLSFDVFIDSIKNNKSIVLKEYIAYSSNIQSNNTGETFANQFIGSIIHNENIYKKIELNVSKSANRDFYLGSEWLYYKIYCGAKAADQILINCLSKCINKANKLSILETWFFIRYNDPEPHIRVRFKLKDRKNLNEMIQIFNDPIATLLKNKIVWKLQIDTYERELERYGADTMDFNEQLFAASSKAVLAFLSFTNGDEREDLRWLFGMKLIDKFLDSFNFTLESKTKAIGFLKESFIDEFSLTKENRLKIDSKFREKKLEIFEFMEGEGNSYNSIYKKYQKEVEKPIRRILELKRNDTNEMINSQIHMHLNRIISSNQRQHELLLYDYLFRYYRYLKAKQSF